MSVRGGVLSRLVQLEELHMVGVEHRSYSTLRELESLSRLTALSLIKCSKDVIYNNLGNLLTSKLTRYALRTSKNFVYDITSMAMYNRIMILEVCETTPLGDWIRHMLRNSEFVVSNGEGSMNVLTELQLNGFQNVKSLRLSNCYGYLYTLLLDEYKRTHSLNISIRSLTVACPDEEEEISRSTHIGPVIKFPNLYYLDLGGLHWFTHFCNNTIEGIEFPKLWKMCFSSLPEFQNFWPTANNSITHSNPLFHQKVSCPNLKELIIWGPNSVSSLCSHQLPIDYFSKLQSLDVWECGKWRNLMSPSVARECALEIPLLREVMIHKCPEMKTFVQQEVFEQKASQGTTDGDQSEASYGDESEANDGDQSEATDGDKSEASDDHESEATDGDKSEASDDHESEATHCNESEATNGDESEATKSQKGEP
ncbi:hypothetical protein H5410_054205 [Solanum commersonii]|uniref:Uncharacterized protein n=1 Tax=Solanum commersonii TaxID=4109 RepID=A0A9J5X6T6_SOLCO|nr:hypothetical protein H5410_054205 [Solanum commersonii]